LKATIILPGVVGYRFGSVIDLLPTKSVHLGLIEHKKHFSQRLELEKGDIKLIALFTNFVWRR